MLFPLQVKSRQLRDWEKSPFGDGHVYPVHDQGPSTIYWHQYDGYQNYQHDSLLSVLLAIPIDR